MAGVKLILSLPVIAWIVVCHNRYKIAEAVLAHMSHLTKLCSDIAKWRGHVIISANDERKIGPICDEFNFNWAAFQNRPVSCKHQFALDCAHAFGHLDMLLYTGSDDFISEAYIRKAVWDLTSDMESPGIGSLGCYMLDTLTGRMGLFSKCNGIPIGPGRIWRKSTLDAIDWKLWANSNRNRGLDKLSAKALSKIGLNLKTLLADSLTPIVDIKSSSNINSFASLEQVFSNIWQAGDKAIEEVCAIAGVPRLFWKVKSE